MAKDKNRVILSTCVSKIMAFYLVGRCDEAREWAGKLVEHLRKMELIPK